MPRSALAAGAADYTLSPRQIGRGALAHRPPAEELQNRMDELSQSNDDLHNVLAGVDHAVLILGMDLRVRRFTGTAERLFTLVGADVGRPVGFLSSFFGGTLVLRDMGELHLQICLEKSADAKLDCRASAPGWRTGRRCGRRGKRRTG